MSDIFNLKQISTVIYLGAGKCNILESFIANDVKKIVLCEANNYHTNLLSNKAKQYPNVEIVNSVITDEVKECTFSIFNVPEVSSIHKPTGIYELYPGLKVIQEIQVKTLGIKELLDKYSLKSEENNLLIINTPGEEYNIVKYLSNTGMLKLFKQLQIYAGYSELYHQAKTVSEIIDLLDNYNYKLVQEDKTEDTDRPCFIFNFDQLKIDYSELKKRFDKISHELKNKEQALTAANNKISDFTKQCADLSKAVSNRQNELNSLREATNNALVKKQAEVNKIAEEFKSMQSSLADTQKNPVSKLPDESAAEFNNKITALSDSNDKLRALIEYQRGVIDETNLKLKDTTANNEAHIKLIEEQNKKIQELNQIKEQQLNSVSDKQNENSLNVARNALADTSKKLHLLQEKYFAQTEQLNNVTEELSIIKHKQRVFEDICTKAEAQIDLIKEFVIPNSNK